MTSARKGLLTGAVTGVLGLLLYLSPAGVFLERHLGLDLLFNLRGPQPTPPEVVVISIDKASARAMGLPDRPVHWPRSLHAQAVSILARRGAAVIGFDVLFREEGDAPQTDALARAIAEAGNVVLFQYLDKQAAAGAEVESLVPPAASVGEAALALAPFPLPKVPAKISHYWVFKDSVGGVPTMPAVALQLYLLDYYPQWRALLSGLRNDLEHELPATRAALLADHGLVPWMLHQRQLLHDNDHLAARMAAMIRGGGYRAEAREALAAMLALYRGDNERLVNFYGPARTIATIPYHELLQSDGDPARLPVDLRGKAVFVGLSEPLQLERIDTFYTPFSRDDGVDVSGVEIMAGAFANLLRGRTLWPVTGGWAMLIILSLSLLAALLPRLTGTPAAVGAALLLAAGYAFVAAGLFVQAGLWLPLLIPMLLIPVALFLSILWKHLDIQGERDRIRTAFGYYLPAAVVDEIAESFSHLHKPRQLVRGTCVATDAASYTTLGERFGPETLARLMERYYEGLFREVRRHKGVVSDVVGDEMMAFWTEFHSGADHPAKACRAALAIAALSPSFEVDGEPVQLPTRIGIHSGELLVGNIGALDRYEYRAVGDVINTASRLQGLAKLLQQPLLVSAETLAECPDCASRYLGDFVLAGKSRPLQVYALLPTAAAWPETLERQFRVALALFRDRHFSEAAAAFAAIDDPVAAFYSRQSIIYMENNPSDEWAGEVHISHK